MAPKGGFFSDWKRLFDVSAIMGLKRACQNEENWNALRRRMTTDNSTTTIKPAVALLSAFSTLLLSICMCGEQLVSERRYLLSWTAIIESDLRKKIIPYISGRPISFFLYRPIPIITDKFKFLIGRYR